MARLANSRLVDKILTVGKDKVRHVDPDERIQFISTGSRLFDYAFGGFPQRKVTELFGPPNSGKSTLWQLAARKLMQEGKSVLCIDVENSFSNEWAETLGIDRDLTDSTGYPMLNIVRPINAEQAIQVAVNAIKYPHYSMVVIDSVAALMPASLEDIPLDKAARVGESANMNTRFMHLINRPLEESPIGVVVILVNQTRANIGEMYPTMAHTPGGMSIRFKAKLRLEMKRPKDVFSKDGDHLDRLQLGLFVRKNGVSPMKKFPFFANLDWVEELGYYLIDEPTEVYEVSKMLGLFQDKDGNAWNPRLGAFFNGRELGRGEPAIIKAIGSDYELLQELVAEIKQGKKHEYTSTGGSDAIPEPDDSGPDDSPQWDDSTGSEGYGEEP